MGLFNRFSQASLEKQFSNTQPTASSSPAVSQIRPDLDMPDLNLKQVLDAHREWKVRLQNVLDGTSEEQFDIETVSQDCHCFLGKWIYSKGKKQYGHMPEYEVVRKVHAEFHETAGQVLTEHLLGDVTKAQFILKTKFRTASHRNQIELTRLFSVVKAG
jgi:Chemoreceptor zinc-binding domain